MKQVLQSYKTGELAVVNVPAPAVRPGCVLVRNVASLVSAGTEKHMLEMAKKSLVGKALARPDLVRQVIAKARAEGILEAYRQAMNRLDTPVPLGYSCAGIVIDVGAGVEGFSKGDRVACTGSGYASHAEIVCVPKNLCVRIPEGVDFESAAFVALGGIALEAVRLADVTLGSKVVVIGLGLLGQITVQLLKAAGCHVLGVDVVPAKVQMALEHGAEAGAAIGQGDVIAAVREVAPQGADAVIITAATSSNEPLELAAEVAEAGIVDLVEGADMLDAASDAADVAVAAGAAAVEDITRAEDMTIASVRMSQLGEVVAAAGITDVAQGADLLAASDDIQALSAVVGLMDEQDLDLGLEVARTAGELWAVSDVVEMLEMPVLSSFLEERGESLQELAVDIILRAAAMRALSSVLSTTGEEVAELGAEEMAEGVVRMTASGAIAERSEELADVSADLAARGVVEAAVAGAAGDAARDLAGAGIEQTAVGAAEMGAAATLEGLSQDLEEEE